MCAYVLDAVKLIDELKFEDLEEHLQRFPSAIRVLNLVGIPSLHIALRRRRCSIAIVKLLLDYGADPNFEDVKYGSTPLISALGCRDRIGIIRTLIEGGARVDRPDDWILQSALALNAELEVVKLLISTGANLLFNSNTGSPIFFALQSFNVGYFKSLLNLQDVDINTIRDPWNGTLLHTALLIDGCTAEFVKFLIDRGIKVDSVNEFKSTPLHVALGKSVCHPDVIDVLLRKGSLVNVQDKNGDTPLDIAIKENWSPDIVQLLLKYCLLENPDFDVKDTVRGHKLKELFSRYVIDCEGEVLRMNSENVGIGRTLYEFLHIFSGRQMNKNGTEGFNVGQLLEIIARNVYPLYSNVMSSKLERSLLEDKLMECDIFTVVEDICDVKCARRKISLNNDSVHILVNFLKDNDLLNMIMAFYH